MKTGMACSLLLLAVFPLAAQQLKVLSPNGGEVICPNHGEMTVSWSFAGLPSGTLIHCDLVKNGVVTNHIFRNLPVTPASKKWDEMTFSGASGDGYKVRIFTVDGSVFDESDASFSLIHVVPTVKMVSPAGGERWKMWESHRIQWSWTGCPWGINTVGLFLERKPWTIYTDQGNAGMITNSAPFAAGHFDWSVGNVMGGKVISPGSDYKIEVYSMAFVADNIDPNRPNVSAAAFSITDESGQIPPEPGQAVYKPLLRIGRATALAFPLTLQSPAGGEQWNIGDQQRISWKWTGPADCTAQLLLFRSRVLIGYLANSVPASRGYLDWRVGALVDRSRAEPGEGYFIEILVPAAAGSPERRARTVSPITLKPPRVLNAPR